MATKKKKAKPKKASAKKTARPAKPAKAKPAAPAPAKAGRKAGDLAAFLGVALRKPLDREAIRALRQAPPGIERVLDEAAKSLESEKAPLDLEPGLSSVLRESRAKVARLHALEDVAAAVYRSIHDDRLEAEDRALGALQRIGRRVGACSEDDPSLLARWRTLRDYLAGGERRS